MENRDNGKDITIEFILWVAGTGAVLGAIHLILNVLNVI
jgi:hypothetical protein